MNNKEFDIARRFNRLAPAKRQVFLQALAAQGVDFSALPIVAAENGPDSAASYAQARQWFLWKLEPESAAYHISAAWRLHGGLDMAALRAGFAALVQRHAALRTVFRAGPDGQPQQQVLDGMVLDIGLADLAGLPEARRQARRDELVRELCETPFDLETGPLLRVAVLREAADRHLLVVVKHHIISDGRSMQILVGEFAVLYGAHALSLPPALPTIPVQYADYAAWQRNWLEAGERERQLLYWKAQLGHQQPVLQLQVDHARRADARYLAAEHVLELPATLAEALRARARSEGATLFMALLAGWQALLARYSGQDDIRVGVPIANRHRAETEGVVGLFVNTQVLRNRIDARRPIVQVLRQAREAALGAQAHQDLPFDQLVEALQPERNLGVHALFQVMHNHQRAAAAPGGGQMAGLALERCVLEERAAQFELTLNSSEGPDGRVELAFSYAAELFEASTIRRLAGHCQALLEALALRPEQALAEVSLPDAQEQQQLAAWGVNGHRTGGTLPVHRSFEACARRTPDATALVFGDESLSYSQLNRRANRLAHRLAGLGVGPETRVAIAVERSVAMVVGLLAILKAGGAYLPLDPEYPRERLVYMLADSGVRLVLTHGPAHGLLPADPALQVLDLDAPDLQAGPDHDLPVAPDGENLAYVIYTSGSTGRPKGAANRHASLSNCMAWMQDRYQLAPGDAVLHKAPFGFDVSVWEIFWPLTVGVRLVLAQPGDQRDPARIVELIRRHQITTLNFVPSMLQAFLAYEGIETQTRLRHVICGGEAMPAATQAAALRRLRGVSLQNLYGPTEAAIHVTQWTCRDDGRTQVPIGRPISATEALVLGPDLELVPQGVAGELYLGGTALARGYLGRPGLTAERFVAHPHIMAGGARLYRTGDLVRWSIEGQLEYLGRMDHQVKVRGFRIELGEVEAQLLVHAEVREAVVVAAQGPAGARLVAYVAAPHGDAALADTLRQDLARMLPDYMVPSAIVVLPALPLNANGKVDRAALPQVAVAGKAGFEAPQGELESTVAELWTELLQVERVGRQDSFFELGGHSLMALALLERLRALGWQAQVRSLFQQPRMADFARSLMPAAGGAGRKVVVPANGIPPDCEAVEPSMVTLASLDESEVAAIAAAVPGGARNIQDIYPLAPMQEGMLFHHMLQTEGDAYVTSHTLAFDSRERLERFVACFDEVIARHDILRTAVLWQALKAPMQVVWRRARLDLQWLEPGATGGGRDMLARLQAETDPRHYRIDVRSAPMIHALAAQDGAGGRWLLHLPCHHLVLDHATLDLLIQEIALIRQDRRDALPKPVAFRRFVAHALLGTSAAEHEAFFTEMLGDVDEPTAAFGLLDVQGSGEDAEEARQMLEPGLSARARLQAQRHGVSAAALCHLAWALVLARSSGQDDVVFGTVLLGRMDSGEDAQRALGLFINTLPIRIPLGVRPVAECIRQAHAALSGLLHHEHASLSVVQRCSALPGGTPLFSTLLNYRHSQLAQAGDRAAWEGMELLGGNERTNYPVLMSVDDLGRDFALVAQATGGAGAQRLCGYMQTAVAGLVDALERQPGLPACEVPVLDPADILEQRAWGDSRWHGPAHEPVHRIIERQARRSPQAPALVFGALVLDYAELNARANRLANRLIALGVRPETRVGLAVERSADMVLGLLAILKAGGAYVPLDPSYPAQRLAHMLQDSGIGLLLTQSALLPSLPMDGAHPPPVLELDRLDTSGESAADPGVPLHADNLAYVIYTSGSTGRPKGTAMPHGLLSRLMRWQAGRLPGALRTLLFASPCFDVGFQEVVSGLCTGGTLVQTREEERRDFSLLLELVARQRVERLYLPFAVLQLFAEAALHGPALPELRQVITAGEQLKLSRPLLQWLRREPQCRLFNQYGPTESHVVSDLEVDLQQGSELPPIGVPASDARLRVLDRHLQPVPAGVPGELFIASPALARGYLGRPAQTAERFVCDPFDGAGGRLYRTGDLVRWNRQGQLDYLGRMDHQVKIRGFRVELGEIEACLQAQQEVREAVVVAQQAAGGTRLLAYLSAQPGTIVDAEALRQRLARALPDYMVPAVLVVLDTLPLNPNGKVDRRQLPEPPEAGGGDYEAPRGANESALAALWAEVLGVARVGRQDNFFELGGHSLLAMRLLERLRGQGLPAQVRTLFQNPVLSAFAAAIAQQPVRAAAAIPPNLVPAGCTALEPAMLTLLELDAAELARIEAEVPGGAANIQDIYPLAPLQEGMFFHHLLHARVDVYIVSHALGFDSRERLEAFLAAFNTVLARHDILRTAVLWEGLREPVQVVCRQARLAPQWVDEAGFAMGSDGDLARRLKAHVHSEDFRIDVRRAPMVQALAAFDTAGQRWLLQLASHHLVLDHTTLDLMIEEIGLIQGGREAQLAPPVPFRDFVAQARLGVGRAEHEAFFGRMLADVREPSAPFGLLDVQRDGSGVQELRRPLPSGLCDRIRRAAQQEGVGAAALFHLAWALVVSATTGRDDVVFGTVLFGRMHGGEGAGRALGMFINTLPIRARLGAGTMAECLRQTQEALSGLLHHEHASLSLAQRCSGVAAGTPLFTSLFNYRHNHAGGQDQTRDWGGVSLVGVGDRTNFPLTLAVDETGPGFSLMAHVAASVGAERVCRYMLAAVQGVVSSLEEGGTQAAARIDLISPQERAQLLRWGGCPAGGGDGFEPVHRRFEFQARQAPDAPALVFGGTVLSHGELNARANQLAHRLIAAGVRPQDRVGLAVERSVAMVVGLLAILKAGAAYVPLDPAYPAPRLARMLDDSGISLLLTQSHLRGHVCAGRAFAVLELDRLDLAGQSTRDPALALHPQHLAYVVYTSGSTGRPKGVAVAHGPLAMHAGAVGEAYGLTAQDRLLMFASISFDAAAEQWLVPLLSGAAIVLRDSDEVAMDRLEQLVLERGVTALYLPPAYLRQLVAFLAGRSLPVSTCIVGGEAWALEDYRRACEALQPQRIFNAYGPAETVITPTLWQAGAGREPGGAYVPVGRPVGERSAYVLDARLRLLPAGVAGELYLGGGMAQGYLDRAGLSAERFVADPFSDTGGRLYRTGDLVAWDESGELRYQGRIDHQIKVRGLRVEPGEVEAELLAHPAVREAAVVAAQGPGGTRLVAYVAAREAAGLDVLQLKAGLARVLPDYMVPSAIVVLPALPLNANAKVDRMALARTTVDVATDYEAPVGAAEQALAAVWAEVLGLPRIGRHDNFFESGGDSILSLQIVSRARRDGWKVTPRQLFERQTVAQFALVAEAAGERQYPVARAEGEVPLLPVQARFFESDIPARHHWNQALLLQSTRMLEPVHLRSALAALAAHHDSLRLRYRQHEGGRWSQYYQPLDRQAPADLLWVGQAEDAAAVEALCDAAQRSLDLAQGPLLRAQLISLPDGSCRLQLVIHHLVVDGVSWRILLEDLQNAYAASQSGRTPALPPATSSFKDWALALRGYAREHAGEANHWLALDGAAAALPCGHPECDNSLEHQASVELRLDRGRTEALLKRVPAAYRTQVNDVLLTALGRALCAWSGRERVLVDVEGHGREDIFPGIDLSRSVGWFTSQYPVMLEPLGQPGDALRHVKESLRAIPNHGLGHGVFRYFGSPAQQDALAGLPPAQVLFNYLGQFDGSFDAEAAWKPAREPAGAPCDSGSWRSHEFLVNGQVFEGELVLVVSYSQARHDRRTVQAWVRRFEQELSELIAHCCSGAGGVTPSDFPLAGLAQAQLDRLRLAPDNLADLYPLSPIQLGMLFHSLSDAASAAYRSQLQVDIQGLDVDRFRQAWQALLDRHDVLRTAFLPEANPPLQWVARRAALEFLELDWTGRTDLDEALRALAAGQQAAFDLQRPGLMRLAVVRTAADAHRFIWTHHHLLTDGWSTSMLLGEVLRAYAGQSVAGAPPGSYRDYIAWLAGRDAALGQAYWQQQLARLPEPTMLADALPRPARQDGYGEATLSLDAVQTRRLADLARRERVTLNTVVQACWALLLARHTGQPVVAFGATVAGRPGELPGAEQMVGNFINTLPVVCACPGDAQVGAWMRALQEQNLASREHEYTPLYEIQRWAGRGQQALFDSIVVFENYPMDAAFAALGEHELKFSAIRSIDVTTYAMDVEVHAGEVLDIKFIYQRRFFDHRTAQELSGHMRQLLLGLPEAAALTLRELAMLSPVALAGLLVLGQGQPVPAPAPAPAAHLPVHRRIELQARSRPQAIALLMGQEELDYAGLNARANRLAHYLMAGGVGRGSIVGVAMERCLDIIVTQLAVLKAGAAYLPLDPAYPADRLDFMVRDSGMRHLVVHRALRPRLLVDASVTVLVSEDLDLADCNACNPDLPMHERDGVYVIYTSGSTGTPKGVLVEHGPLAMHCGAVAEIYGMGPDSCELHFMSFSFDGAHERWLTALCIGAGLALRDQELWSAEQTYRALHDYGVTNAAFPPAYLGQIADWALARDDAPPVELYVFGGEAMPRAAYDKVRHALQPRQLINGYGPTETVVTPLIWKTEASQGIEGTYAPIGRPVGERTARVLDADMAMVPTGVVGELYIGGYGLARGYLGRAGLTAERFVADPLGGGGRLYRTGDLVRWMPDGNIEFMGRLDAQVKIRGFRIELGEIEAGVRDVHGVLDAAVCVHDAGAGPQLVAYAVPAQGAGQGQDGLERTIRRQLGERFPDYMVPRQVMLLPGLPRLVSGKLDRKALPAPQAREARVFAAPSTPEAALLAGIWQQVLAVERVGETDNFFELGGDSLSSLKVHALVRQLRHPGLNFQLRDLLQRPTIAALLGLKAAGQPPQAPGLVRLNGAATQALPLVCIHGGLGTVFDYQPLARRLEGVRTVYGLACPLLADAGWPAPSLNHMAQTYCDIIRRALPRGPYHLLGWSLGATLAALVARCFEAQGEQPAFVGMVDPFVPGAGAGAPEDWKTEFSRFLTLVAPGAGLDKELAAEPAPLPDAVRIGGLIAVALSQGGRDAADAYAGMGGEELAQVFLAAWQLKRLSAAAPDLQPLRCAPTLWWCQRRSQADRQRLAQQLGGGREEDPAAREVAEDHFSIMRSEAVVGEPLLRGSPGQFEELPLP
jgi:amino acid adenylation domain-containing protein/non-ribosomal peptide synthase protein (TIGR01720 family)